MPLPLTSPSGGSDTRKIMIVIRQAQLDSFTRAEWQRFLDSIAAEVRAILALSNDPRVVEPLDRVVHDAVKLAQDYGLRTRPELLRFARAVVVAGSGWQPPAESLLSDEDLPPEDLLAFVEANARV